MNATATKKRMRTEQAKMLVRMLFRPENPPVIIAAEEALMVAKADEYEAHSIISYCLSHLMSDEDNARYITEALEDR